MLDKRNISIGKLLTSPKSTIIPPSFDELSLMTTTFQPAKADVGLIDVPKILREKKVILSPPRTEFKVPIYPLKRIKKGLSGYDWSSLNPNFESEENKISVTRLGNSPRKDTFASMFPCRNPKHKALVRNFSEDAFHFETINKEFNIKSDDIVKYREAMIRASKLLEK
ncbi:unnamed protein product [Blepharisma stoltei]|uniref:Uncharacterized protein n=1 Tax=Blepharisma stoltei TaxID=1481888 RepID=A0AAU9JD49_9CILI|nr:unnamed protein product [Blepharisma stoltei]